MPEPLIGIVDTGINAWHSHVRGDVWGCRIFLDQDGRIREDDDFSDPSGHGTAVAAILRQALPSASLFGVRVFDRSLVTWPSLVARGILRAAAEGCALINMSLTVPPGPGASSIVEACEAARQTGAILVAAGDPGQADLLPACLPGVYRVISDNTLAEGAVLLHDEAPFRCRAPGLPRTLDGIARAANLHGHSLACARASAYLALRREW